MKQITVLLLLAATSLVACTAIAGERIRAGEIAAAVPVFETLDKATDLGPAPAPSVKRVLSRSQLVRMAAVEGLPVEGMPEHLCIERHQQILASTVLLTALESAVSELFPGQEVRVELLDFVQHALPAGTVRFQRQGVVGGATAAADGPVLWRGALTTGEKRSLPIWAKARILVARSCWSSAVDLPAGSQPEPSTFRATQRWLNPFLTATDCADPNAKPFRVRRSLPAGQSLLRSDLIGVPSVRRGEPVQASLAMANASLSFPAVAETDGELGQSILIRHDGKRLRAKVNSAGSVQVVSGGAH
jgi:Chaperone for flagella basal body P-ring formation